MASKDDRFPYDAVVSLSSVIDGVTYRGTGILIAPDQVLTAAHVVYSTAGGDATSVTAWSGADRSQPLYQAAADAVHHLPIVMDGTRITTGETQSDFALLHLALSLPVTAPFGLLAGFTGGTAMVAGYPDGTNALVTQSQAVGALAQTSDLTFASLGHGSSGGPIAVATATGYAVVGVISSSDASGQGYAGSLTQGILDQVTAWATLDERTLGRAPNALEAGRTPIGRYFDRANGSHVYTTDAGERSALDAKPGMVRENAGFGAYDAGTTNGTATPVFRFFDLATGAHFLTASADEEAAILAARGRLRLEGAPFAEHMRPQAGDVAVHRFFDAATGSQLLTASEGERATAAAMPEMRYEGIAFYAPATT